MSDLSSEFRGAGISKLCAALILASFLALPAGAESPAPSVDAGPLLFVSPIEGLTSSWHEAPAETSIPLGSVVYFRVGLPDGSEAVWQGAEEVRRAGGRSTAECRLDRLGRHMVEVEILRPGVQPVVKRSVLEVVDVRPEEIEISTPRVRVKPFPAPGGGPAAFKASGLDSIAALREVGEDRYRTSTDRWIHFDVEVEPAGFAPLVEWRLGSRSELGARVRNKYSAPGTYTVGVGPQAHSRSVSVDAYSVALTGPGAIQDGEPATFAAQTEPPGHEEEVTWFADTTFGSASPSMGQGQTFTVVFSGTNNPQPASGEPTQWLSVQADNAIFQQHQSSAPDVFPSTGTITVRVFPDMLQEFPDGFEETLSLSSEGLPETVVMRTPPPYADCVENGFPTEPGCPEIQTEMTQLELAAFSENVGQVMVQLRQDVASLGSICNVDADEQGNFLSGDSWFQIFADVYLLDFGVTLTTLDQPIQLQAAGITELPPDDRCYEPPPPDDGVCELPTGPETVPLYLGEGGQAYFSDKGVQVGEIIHSRHCVDPPEECTITLTDIMGARKNTVGDFSALADPHSPGRIFIDTVMAGNILAAPDRQNVKLLVQLGPPTLDPAKYEVLWEARDPDDPADHKDVDPNDGGTPRGGTPKGGDNIDPKPEETTDGNHFFRQADHAISKRMSPGSDGMSANTVIGKGTTVIDAQLKSSAKFHYGDEGGDNYQIQAHCVRKADDTKVATDTSGILTVWRQRLAKAHAMTKQNDDVQVHAVGANPGANVVCIQKGPNGKTDTMILGGDDQYAGEDVNAGADGTVQTTANSGGNNFYPSNAATQADLLSALRTSYARVGNAEDFNHAAYIDFVLSNGTLNLPFDVQINQRMVEWAEYLDMHLHGADKTHANNTHDLIGIADFTNVRGSARQNPHVGVGVQFVRNHAGLDVNGTIAHELGHSLNRDGTDTHDGHTDGATQADCVFEQSSRGAMGMEICEKHTRVLRMNVTRSWPNHDKTKINQPENARDSD